MSASTLGRATTVARGVGRSMKETEDVASAQERLTLAQQELAALQQQIEAEAGAIAGTTDPEIELTHVVPGSAASRRTVAEGSALQRPLWTEAVRAVQQEPQATAPRLYEDSLNDMIDQQTVRVAGLSNRVPTEVLLLEVLGAGLAMFLLGLHVGVLGRSYLPVLLAAGLVSGLLFVTFDLDRPTRGRITISDTPLTSLR